MVLGSVNKYVDKKDRGFAVVDQTLGDGICGAPVLDREGKCLGMVEGVVPPQIKNLHSESEVHRSLANNMGFIYGRQLKGLLEEAKADEGFKEVAVSYTSKAAGSSTRGKQRHKRRGKGHDDDDSNEGPLNPFKWLE